MNIIEIPLNHKMFSMDFEVEICNFIYDEFGFLYTTGENIDIGIAIQCQDWEKLDFTMNLICLNNELMDAIIYDVKYNDKSSDGMDVFCSSFDEKYTYIGHDLACLAIRSVGYIMMASRKYIEKERSSNIKKREHKINNGNKENKICLLDDIVKYISSNEKYINNGNGNIIKCPCWSVRGHYRHYKSGKTIFIKNYVKGKEKDNAKPKEHKYYI